MPGYMFRPVLCRRNPVSAVAEQLSRRTLSIPKSAKSAEREVDSAPTTVQPLRGLPLGATAHITGFSNSLAPQVVRRLLDLGFTPGLDITPVRCAPLHDPVIYRVGGIEIALRARESVAILIDTASSTAAQA